MDPKKISNLDPKLKEVYERVMGTPVNAPAVPSQQPQPSQPPQSQQVQVQPPSASQTPSSQFVTAESTAAINPKVIVKETFVTSPGHTKGKMSPRLFIIIGILLLAAYAFFWIKFFNFKLPF